MKHPLVVRALHTPLIKFISLYRFIAAIEKLLEKGCQIRHPFLV